MPGGRLISDLLWGLLAGLLCALGGAVKDSRYEGFRPAVFPRSIVAGFAGGLVAWILLAQGIVALAVAGYFERAVVEGWKILRGQRPGKFWRLGGGNFPPAQGTS